jgi:hypothetical protein
MEIANYLEAAIAAYEVPEEAYLSRPRRALAEIAEIETRPRRIVRLGLRDLALGELFPRASIREGRLPERGTPTWSGWPDLVWCDHALAGRDPFPVVCALQTALSLGATIAVVEVENAPTPLMQVLLADQLSLVPTGRALARLLRVAFAPVHEGTFDNHRMWRSFVYLGRR